MGLRELKAARTRQHIIDVAFDLFIDQGYDETTMEQIAERAEVGSTTLYRYFPSKDLLILDSFSRMMDLGSLVRERPADEPLNVALGAAIHQVCEALDAEDGGRGEAIRKIVDSSPVPRARLWDLAAQAQNALQAAVAERMRRPVDDLQVMMTSHITFAVYQIVTDNWRDGDHRIPHTERIDEVLRTLNSLELVLPSPVTPVRKKSARQRRATRAVS
jgi:AcrR family transcriptional regulator